LSILEESIAIWWKNLKQIILVYLWGVAFALIPALIVLALVLLVNRDFFDGHFFFQFISFFIILGGSLVAAYFLIRGYLAIFLLIKNNYQGQPLAVFKETRPLFWSYLGVVLLTLLFVLLWSLLLIIPGLIYSVFYSLVVYVFVFEGLRGRAALRRSQELVRHYWWPVFGRSLFIGLVVWLASMIIAIPGYFQESGIFSNIWAVVLQIAEFIIGPIVAVYTYQIYRDLVKIKSQAPLVNSNNPQNNQHESQDKQ
jgi:hypothetical protein